jgi:hypothetical protein
MWRVFIRCSFNNDDNSAMENYLERLFVGFTLRESESAAERRGAATVRHDRTVA